ncbi:ECF transporter S component [Microbacterium sp.]|uniref:ECF transporter S component n=1 Tax=Microbacterium sp. TaxID=51671 RepID=UPI003C75EE02
MSEISTPAEAATAPRPHPRRRYTTRTILTAVALGAAVGVILIPINFAQGALTAAAPMVAVAIYGVWGMSALIPLALLRRAGTGVIGGTAAGIVTIISPYGVFMVIMMRFWGVLMELPFLVTRYRLWGWKTFTVAGIVTGAIACAMSIGSLNLLSMETGLVVGICVIQVVSFVICSLLSLAIARGLSRTGIAGGRRERVAR